MRRIERMIEIDAPAERVFDLFSDFESWPRWMRHIKDVRRTGRRYTRWTADAPLGTTVEWEAETTVWQPDRRIAWRSVRGDVETDGEVLFQETGRRTTLLRIMLGYSPPGGRLGDAVARLFGTNPEQQLEEDLERFKRIAEGRGGNGRRSRGYDERADERDYAARQPYEQRDYGERARYDRRESFMSEREDYEPRDRAQRSSEYDERGLRSASSSYAGARERGDEGRERRGRDERRFDEALREARHSQIEGMRRYNEERERAGRHYREPQGRQRDDDEVRKSSARSYSEDYADDEHHARVRPRSSGTYYYDERARDDADRGRRDEIPPRRAEPEARPRERDEPEYRPRYALTPRERERERPQRQREREEDAKKMLRRRGVDRLLDNPPSKDWRRWEEE